MTTTFQSTDLFGSDILFSYAATGDSYYVLDGVTVASTGVFEPISGFYSDLTLSIDGTVIGGDGSAALYLTGGESVLSVGSTGVVRSSAELAEDYGVYLGQSNNLVVNDGLIASERSIAVFVGSSSAGAGDNEVINTGTIIGATGVFLGFVGSAGDQLTNSGQIIATDINATGILSNGSNRYDHGVFSEGDNTEILNLSTGEISASSKSGAGVLIGGGGSVFESDFGGDGSRVINHGSITSVQFWGVDFDTMKDSETATLQNFGLIQGGTGAFRGNASGEDILNSGMMLGDVDLGGGADSFDGRGGTVVGDVLGGTGDDSFYVDDTALSLVENTGEGTDHVFSDVSWLLDANFEYLTLLGTQDINGTGNGLDNVITGNAGDNGIRGQSGHDTLNGAQGDDALLGGAGDDALNGGSGDDMLRGGANNDRLSGDDGDDMLRGGIGRDVLIGGDGDDVLIGGAGRDDMYGNDGSDVFRFLNVVDSPDVGNARSTDRIFGFDQGEDVIDLQWLVAGTLDFIGSSAFGATGQAEVQVTDDGTGNGEVRIDVNGDGTSDMMIRTNAVVSLTELDFLL